MAAGQNRIGLTLNGELLDRFNALAELEGTKAATLATDIIKAYMHEHAAEIDSAIAARENYQRALAEVRSRKSGS